MIENCSQVISGSRGKLMIFELYFFLDFFFCMTSLDFVDIAANENQIYLKAQCKLN
jgi:hypothetical protein